MRSPAWHIPCYTLFCRSDEPVSPLVLESGLMWLHSEQVQDPSSEKKTIQLIFLNVTEYKIMICIHSRSFEEQQ